MEIKQIITATIAVILITLVAIPLINTSAESIQTESQNTTEWFSMAADEDVTIEFGENGVYTLNGVQIDNPSTISWSMKCFSPQIMIKFNNNAATANAVLADKTRIANISKVVYSNGTLEITTTTNTSTINVDFFYYMDPKGTWGMFQGYTLPIHIDKDQEYYVIGQSSIVTGTGEYASAFLYKNGERISTVFNPIFTETYNGELTDATVELPMTIDQVDSKHFDITAVSKPVVNGNVSFSVSSAYVVAPLEYHMISENDSIIITLLEIVPVLLIAALLLGIGYSIMRRD